MYNPPVRATPKSAGLDLLLPHNVTVHARQRIVLDLTLRLTIPTGCCGRIASKSGLANFYGIEIGTTVIGSPNTDIVKIIVYNFSTADFYFSKGNPIAQLIVERFEKPELRMDPNKTMQRYDDHSKEKTILYYWKFEDNAYDLESVANAVGYIIKTPIAVTIPARDRILIRSNIGICLPAGCYGRLTSTNDNALQYGIEVGGGVIDEDYRGNIGVILHNHTDNNHTFQRGDVIAQLVCQPICYTDAKSTTNTSHITPTERGDSGFGSSYLLQK